MDERNETHAVQRGDELLGVSRKLGEEIDEVTRRVGVAAKYSVQCGKKLEGFTGSCRHSASLAIVGGHVGGILAETQKVCDRNLELEARCGNRR